MKRVHYGRNLTEMTKNAKYMSLKKIKKEEITSVYERCSGRQPRAAVHMCTDRYLPLLAGVVLVLLCFTCCDDEIPYRKLPEKARNFIETYFPTESCIYAERDKDDGRKEYEVKLSNGTEIEFYQDGEWKSVDCKFSPVPEGIVPQAILEDLAERYPGMNIYKADRELGGYEISIGNGRELLYSVDGTFVREEIF